MQKVFPNTALGGAHTELHLFLFNSLPYISFTQMLRVDD